MTTYYEQLRQSPYQVVLIILLASTGLYLHGVSLQNHLVNTNPRQTDQRTYIMFAQQLRETNYNYIVPRNQMPVYPLLQSLVYKPGMTEAEYFAVGKDLNTYLSLVILAILFWFFKKRLPPLMTLILMLITGFLIFMFKAPFFQSELLFYLLNFIGFLLLIRMVRQPTVELALVTGMLFGVAHMTKASVSIGLGLFLLVSAVKILVDLAYHRLPYQQVLRERAVPLTLMFIVFMLSISVYLVNSKSVYGQYFYNVNSTFYLWYDKWAEAKVGTIAHGDHYGWPDLPAEEIPSFSKYMREHTAGQMVKRVQDGLLRVVSNSLLSYGYAVYVLAYSILLFSFSVVNWRDALKKVRHHFFVVFFVAAYFLSYLLAVAWFSPLASGNRFILAYFLPYMFGLFFILRSAEDYFGVQAKVVLKIFNVLVLIALMGHIYYVMTTTISTFYGGL